MSNINITRNIIFNDASQNVFDQMKEDTQIFNAGYLTDSQIIDVLDVEISQQRQQRQGQSLYLPIIVNDDYNGFVSCELPVKRTRKPKDGAPPKTKNSKTTANPPE